MTRALRVAVIGGGIGGLAAARALLMRGMDVTVYEQAPRLSEFGGGVVLTPNALTALRALGLEARVLAEAFESVGQCVRSWRSGRVISRNSFARYRAHFGATSCSIHRGDMQKVLSEFVPENNLRLSARCTGVTPGPRGAIAHFANGSEIEADVVVAMVRNGGPRSGHHETGDGCRHQDHPANGVACLCLLPSLVIR